MLRKHTLFAILTGFILALAMSGCYYDAVLEPLEEEVTDEVSFANDIIPIFNKSCNSSGCHNTGGIKPDLTAAKAYTSLTTGNYINTASPDDSELLQWMKGKRSTPMPLTGPDATYNALVSAWIKQGANNN